MGGFFSVEQGPFYNSLPKSNMMNNSSIKNANRINVVVNKNNTARANRIPMNGVNLEKGQSAIKNNSNSKINVVVAKNNTARANRVPMNGVNLEKGQGGIVAENNSKINVVVNSNTRKNNRGSNRAKTPTVELEEVVVNNSGKSVAAPRIRSNSANLEMGSDAGSDPGSPTSSQAGGARKNRKASRKASRKNRRNSRK
jgi:hypothetical protein